MIGNLSRQGLTVLMTTHLPNHAFLCSSRVALMNNGRFLAVGGCEEVMSEGNLRTTYGIDLRILTADGGRGSKPIRFCVPAMPG